jgi:uncharacterized protein
MATLNLDNNQSFYQIKSYQPGSIQINDQIFTHSVIITPNELIESWPPQTVAELSAESLAPIAALQPNILLIGTGSQLIFLRLEIYGELINLGIGVEIMDTGAACRTFNALTSEDRNVVAALIIR